MTGSMIAVCFSLILSVRSRAQPLTRYRFSQPSPGKTVAVIKPQKEYVVADKEALWIITRGGNVSALITNVAFMVMGSPDWTGHSMDWKARGGSGQQRISHNGNDKLHHVLGL